MFLHLQCCRPVCQSPAPFLHCSGTTDLERTIHPLLGEDFSLRFRGGPKAICEKQNWNLQATEPNLFIRRAATRNSAIKIMNRIGDKGQAWQNSTFTGNESHLLPAIRPKLTLLQYRDWMAPSKAPFTPYIQGAPNRCLCVRSCKPFPHLLKTGRLTGEASMPLPVNGKKLVHCFLTECVILFQIQTEWCISDFIAHF